MRLLEMSFASSILILFIVILRAFLIRRLPKTLFLILWEIAALRLLLPFSISLPFHVLPHSSTATNLSALQEELIGKDMIGPSIAEIHPANDARAFVLLWCVGTIILSMWFLVSFLRNIQKFRTALPCSSKVVQAWLESHKSYRSLEVRLSDQIVSPLTYGVLHPVILLPKNLDDSDEETLHAILLHEYVHVRRFDGIMKILFAAALCIHWWNPLVWVLYVFANRDMELSCDASVICQLGTDHRVSYALTLIAMAEKRSHCASLHPYYSNGVITERIESIMKFQKTSIAAFSIATVIAIGSAGAVFAKGSEDPVETVWTPDGELKQQISVAAKTGNSVKLSLNHLEPVQDHQLKTAEIISTDDGSNIKVQSKDTLEGMVDLEMQALPPLDIPDDFKAAVQRNDVEPLKPEDNLSVWGVDEKGNVVPYKMNDSEMQSEAVDASKFTSLNTDLISVSHDDEHHFTSEEWSQILEKIQAGEISWED